MQSKLVAFTLALVALNAGAQSSLTNDMIIKLVISGMPEDSIVRVINSQPGQYETSAGDLSILQKDGVTPAEIAAMLEHKNSAIEPSGTQESGLALRDGTPIRLRLTRTLSSSEVSVGEKIDFDVLDDVRVGNQIVIRRGTKAIGTITQAEPKRRMGRAGKLNFVLEYVRLENDTKVTLRAARETSGGGHVGAMTAGMVATSLFVWPAAPLFLMIHGKDAVVPEGTQVMAYVDGDAQVAVDSTIASK